MNRQSSPTLLLPIMAVLALIYPVANSVRQSTPTPASQSNFLRHTKHKSQPSDATTTPSSAPASPTTANASNGSKSSADPAKAAAAKAAPKAPSEKITEPAEKKLDTHNARKILGDFFGQIPIGSVVEGESSVRSAAKLDFIIATVPDPLESRLPYMFDRSLGSIARAAEAANYVMDRYDLPWLDELRQKSEGNDGQKSSDKTVDPEKAHHAEMEPGYLLFRQLSPDPDAKDSNNKTHPAALLVFLVGETPTTGIHKSAMLSALDEIAGLCGSPPLSSDLSKIDTTTKPPSNIPAPIGDVTNDDGTKTGSPCHFIKILGPSFSGSAESLDFALHSWVQSRHRQHLVSFHIISGMATAISYRGAGSCQPSFFKFRDDYPQFQSSFSATVIPDALALTRMLAYLADQQRDTGDLRVALLTEGNTAYGSALRSQVGPPTNVNSVTKDPSAPAGPACPPEKADTPQSGKFCSSSKKVSIVHLPFPLHISRVRSESEKIRQERQKTSAPETQRSDPSLTLPLPTEDDSGDAIDSIPPVSQLDISSSELMLSNLLSTVSREQFHYVGIAATDARDVIFLAREIRDHSASAVIFAVNADLLYAHPEANPNTRGMLIATPYPLFSLNQRWMSKNPEEDSLVRIQFPDQSSEGIYNAMLLFLGDEGSLLEYGSPFIRKERSAESPKSFCETIENWLSRREDQPARDPQKQTQAALQYQSPDDPKKWRSSPRLWLVTVGRDGYWPVGILGRNYNSKFGLKTEANTYTQSIFAEPGDNASNRGIAPHIMYVVLVLWSLLCLVPALIVLLHVGERFSNLKFARRLTMWIQSASPQGQFFHLQGIDANSFYLVASTATLATYGVAISAYFASAIQPADWFRAVIVVVSLVIFLVGLVSCVSLTADILASVRRRHRLQRPEVKKELTLHRSVVKAILAAIFVCWVLVAWLTASWLLGDSSKLVLTGFRAVNLQNGVSPLPPLFFIALAGILWAVCSIFRLLHLRALSPVPPLTFAESIQEEKKDFRTRWYFYSDQFSFRGLRSLEKNVRGLLSSPTLLSSSGARVPVCLTIVMLLIWGIYLFFFRLVYAFESTAFYWLLGTAFLLVAAGVLSNVVRLYLLWSSVRGVLQRLARLPMRDAFSRFRSNNRTVPRMTLATAPAPLTALSLSIVAARELLASAQKSLSLVTHHKEFDAVVDNGKDTISRAKISYEHALALEAARDYKLSCKEQIKAHRFLNSFTRSVESLLNLSWGTSFVASGESEELEKTRKDLEAEAEEFLVCRTVHFLSHVFPQMTNLAVYSLGCLFLMLLAISSYPLQPKNPFSYFSWFIILAFIAVAINIAVQMNRDVVLSCLNGTNPGEINWDVQFIGRILFLVVVPLLGLLGVQFPERLAQIMSWISPSGSGHG